MKIAEIKAACPGASPEFVMAQAELCEANPERGETEVLKAYNAELVKANEAERAKTVAADTARAEAEAAAAAQTPPAAGAKRAPGVPPLPTGSGASSEGESSGDPIGDFEAAVRARMESHKEPRHLAVRAVANGQPELLDAYEAAHTARFAPVANRKRGQVERTAV